MEYIHCGPGQDDIVIMDRTEDRYTIFVHRDWSLYFHIANWNQGINITCDEGEFHVVSLTPCAAQVAIRELRRIFTDV